ncbi:MAG: hypothetical protein RL481_1927, partial [Pseudomonadota bacterium]
QQLRAHIAVLASDEFAGREPGTAGDAKATSYISEQWQKAGLKPAAHDGSWLDPVQLVRRKPETTDVQFFARSEKLRFADDELVLVSREPDYAKEKLPLWFAGYGINADGKVSGDVAGKVVLFLADRPAFGPDDMRPVRARREALVAAGAEAVIAVGGEQAEYPLIRRQLLSRPIYLVSQEKRAAVEGVVGARFAVAMVTAAGGDWDKLRKSADDSSYQGAALGITGNFKVQTDVNAFVSHNVIGKVAGKKPGSGAVLFMAHWDHLGLCRPEGEPDRICNGAVDNASGIAVLTEIGRGLAKSRPDRDIYFLATTAEESGLYGAHAFAENPVVPLDTIVVAMNIDTIAVAPRGSKVAIIGRGNAAIDTVIETVAKKAKRRVETTDEADDFVRRQDGWALAQKGVPAVMLGSAFADMALTEKFLSGDYHGPEDELRPDTQLGGAVDDAMLHIELGKYFGSLKKFPVPKPANKTGG